MTSNPRRPRRTAAVTAIGAFVESVLDGPLPWTRMRQVYELFRAV